MKIYSEKMGEKPLDWNKFLSKKSYTDFEIAEACSKANDWITCACGNQYDVIPREDDGKPIHKELIDLGCDFSEYIFGMEESYQDEEIDEMDYYKEKAIECLAKIELRSEYLIKKQKSIK